MSENKSRARDEGREAVRGLFSSKSFVAALAFLVLLVLGLVWVVGDRVLSTPSAPAPQASQASAPRSAVGGPAQGDAPGQDGDGASVCGLAPGDQNLPSGPLESEMVPVTSTLTVPSVQGVGPGVTDGISRCFAHSPTGAVVASANFMRWLSSKEKLDEVVETLMVQDANRDRMAAQVEVGWDGRTAAPQAIRGYRAEVRTPDEVAVTLLTSPGAQQEDLLMSWTFVMRWQDGDWKVQAPDNDSWAQQPETSDAGFSAWSVR